MSGATALGAARRARHAASPPRAAPPIACARMTDAPGLDAALRKLRADGASEATITAFEHYARRLAAGDAGVLREDEIEPVATLPDAEDAARAGHRRRRCSTEAVVIKLNGGLGTSMGMTAAKSLLPVKDGLTLPRRHRAPGARAARRAGARLPLVLMNSFATREDSLAALGATPSSPADLPLGLRAEQRAEAAAPTAWSR